MLAMKMIKCNDCQLEKPLDQYPSRMNKSKIVYAIRCFPCDELRRNKIKNNKRLNRRASEYGLTTKQLVELETYKECTICGVSAKLDIDHCHRSNVIRGMLCHSCNIGLGWLEKMIDKNILIKSIEYIENCGTQLAIDK